MNVFWGFLTVDMAFKAVFNRASMGGVVAHSRCGASIFADFSMVPFLFSHSFLKTVRSIVIGKHLQIWCTKMGGAG